MRHACHAQRLVAEVLGQEGVKKLFALAREGVPLQQDINREDEGDDDVSRAAKERGDVAHDRAGDDAGVFLHEGNEGRGELIDVGQVGIHDGRNLRVLGQPFAQLGDPGLRDGHEMHDGGCQGGDRVDQLGEHDDAEEHEEQHDQQQREHERDGPAPFIRKQGLPLFGLSIQQAVKQAHGHAEQKGEARADDERRERGDDVS